MEFLGVNVFCEHTKGSREGVPRAAWEPGPRLWGCRVQLASAPWASAAPLLGGRPQDSRTPVFGRSSSHTKS